MRREDINWNIRRESREMERPPPPTRGEPGDFRDDCRKQRWILAECRARKDWTPKGKAVAP